MDGAEWVRTRADYAGWLNQLHNNVEQLVKTLPETWLGWEPTNEQMRMLHGLREMVKEQRAMASGVHD
jgi:hypothetical protein